MERAALPGGLTNSIELALVGFATINGATDAFASARDRWRSDALWIRQAGLVERHRDGHWVVRGVFAGHYLDIDEALHVSQVGAAEGAAGGAALGVLLGPPGLAAGLVIGATIGSQLGHPTERDSEPQLLIDELHNDLPDSGSAIALIAPTDVVNEMLASMDENDGNLIRHPLTADQVIALEASLSGTALASEGPSVEGEALSDRTGGVACDEHGVLPS